jgi:hypothetical protein
MAWNGTTYEINAHGHATDVVGYVWNTEEFCPSCTLKGLGLLTTGLPTPLLLESQIQIYGLEYGLEEDDPRWKDTGVIPQPIFNGEEAYDEDGRARQCASCHEQLVEQDEDE